MTVSRRVVRHISQVASGLSVLLVMCLCTVPAHAQAVGIKAGLSFVGVSIDPPDVEAKGQVGLVAGGFFLVGQNSRFGGQVDVIFSKRRVTFGDDIEDAMTYLEVPAVARFAVVRMQSLSVHALGGLSFGYLMSAEESINGADPFDIKADVVESIELATVLGAQVSWNDRWVFDGRYQWGMTEVYQQPPDGVKARQNGFQFTVGYRFW